MSPEEFEQLYEAKKSYSFKWWDYLTVAFIILDVMLMVAI